MESGSSNNDDSIQLRAMLRRALFQVGWLALWVVATIYIFRDSYNTEGLRHLRLIQSSAIISGQIIEASEEAEDRDIGGVDWYCDLIYEYSVNQKYYKGEHRNISGRAPNSLPKSVIVEYVPKKPAISRIKGVGPTNYLDWFAYTFIGKSLIGLFTALFAGIQLIRLRSTLGPLLDLKISVPKDYDKN